MRYLAWLILVLLIAEVLSIVLMANLMGGLATFGLMVLSFVVGSFILRRNAGFAKVLMAGEFMRAQQGISVYQMMWPIRIPMAGLLLMSPGFLSSIGALILLLPIKGKPMSQTAGFAGFGGFKSQSDDIIDGDFTVQTKHKQPEKQQSWDIIEHQKD